jgi:3-hydroxyisobutyrate dehydrogenase
LTRDNAASLDVLITMLPNSAIVEGVLLGGGNDGWASRLAKGAVVIDMSSSEPERSRKLGSMLEERGLAYLDAPVSGGVKKAKEGTLAILVGGRSEVLTQCMPVLEAMGKSILHIGGAGSGHAAKALNNYVSAAGLAATVEALLVAQRFGIEPDVMTDVLNASSGRSNTSENKVKQFMLSGTFASGFALQLMNKDLKIAHALAQSVGYPMTLGDTVTAVWGEAAQRSTPATDHTEMYRLLDRDAL